MATPPSHPASQKAANPVIDHTLRYPAPSESQLGQCGESNSRAYREASGTMEGSIIAATIAAHKPTKTTSDVSIILDIIIFVLPPPIPTASSG